jgi:glycosyltransferase involved in cell wall biosynthesis
MSKKISIITINYNDKEGLKKTIESVVAQTWQDFEFLVIDGGSTDGGKEVIEQYESHFDYWISEPDKGVYNAMNKGIRAAKGDFVLFLNSGDVLHKDDVLEKVNASINNDYGIYYGDVIIKKPNSERHKKYPDVLSFSYFYTGALCHQACFIKRSLFEEYFYYNEDYKIYSDGEFFIYTICSKNVPYKHLDLIISIYDFTGISSNPKYSAIHDSERMQTINKYFPLFAEDYKALSRLNSKRTQQLFYIEKFPFAWKLVKGIMNLVLVFLPKQKK